MQCAVRASKDGILARMSSSGLRQTIQLRNWEAECDAMGWGRQVGAAHVLARHVSCAPLLLVLRSYSWQGMLVRKTHGV